MDLKLIKKLVRESIDRLILEKSQDVYSEFVKEIKNFAKIASERDISSYDYQHFLKKYNLKPDLDPKEIIDIVNLSKNDQELIANLKSLYTGITDANSSNTTLQAADPESRVGSASVIDKIMKKIWQSEAKKYPDFWANFETWHAVGGIVGGEKIDYSVYHNFPRNMTDEISCYGAPGMSGESLNPAIHTMMLSNPNLGWESKVHFRIKGSINFAAHYDIVTEWLKLKKENDREAFQKHANFSKIASNSESLIVGPSDKITNPYQTKDNYNEVIVGPGFVSGICCNILAMLGLGAVKHENFEYEILQALPFTDKNSIDSYYEITDLKKKKEVEFKYSKRMRGATSRLQLDILQNFVKMIDTKLHETHPIYDIVTGRKLSNELIFLLKENAKIMEGFIKIKKDKSVLYDPFREEALANKDDIINVGHGISFILSEYFRELRGRDININNPKYKSFIKIISSFLPYFGSEYVLLADDKSYQKVLRLFYDKISGEDFDRSFKFYTIDGPNQGYYSSPNDERIDEMSTKLRVILNNLKNEKQLNDNEVVDLVDLLRLGVLQIVKIYLNVG